MLKIGAKVYHSGHKFGTIVAYNGQSANQYVEQNLGEPILNQAIYSGLCDAIVKSFYNGDRFPYVIKFDSGYQDVYALTDVVACEETT